MAPPQWIPGFAHKNETPSKPCPRRAFLFRRFTLKPFNHKDINVFKTVQVLAIKSSMFPVFLISTSGRLANNYGFLHKVVMPYRNCLNIKLMLANSRNELRASQFFHIAGHRIEAAKGLAPHARFGGLLFARDLPPSLPAPGSARLRQKTGLAQGVTFRIIRPSRSL